MLRLYNTLSKQTESFSPRDPKRVSLYCCGPTVYDYAHIGNFRTYTLTDLLVRTLKYLGYQVKYVMNVTDVGHLVSDADAGEDKLEKGARREGKTAWEIAAFYTEAFLADSRKLNLLEPDVRPKPTEHISEQIAMVRELLAKGYAYEINDGIYFDTSKFVGYGQLTGQNLQALKAGARVEENEQKRHPTDFALWKLSPSGVKRQMEWDSPWGVGFPGWHIECSAMIRRHLGEQIDIHTGGADLIPIHHTNEIAQSEGASGKSPFVKYWVHGQFIQIDGEKMAKSRGNFYRLDDLFAKGYDPLALRYLYLTAHYRAFLNFSWEALSGAQQSLTGLRQQLGALKASQSTRSALSAEKLAKTELLQTEFRSAVTNDLNFPKALAVVWQTLKSNIPPVDKYDLIMAADEVLGLDLDRPMVEAAYEIPLEVDKLLAKRESLRKARKFTEADKVRKQIFELGFEIEDAPTGAVVKPRGG